MRDRLATPDIMSDLMCGSGEQVNNKELTQEISSDNKAIKHSKNKSGLELVSIDKTSSSIIKEAKEKTTFNLSEKILRELEDCWMEARRLAGDKQISKTLIVEKALEIALEDFNTKKQSGRFYGIIVNNKKPKR
jgi:hypothetical protein